MMVSAKAIDALLPQTQCGECGFAGCMPYAEALATGSAPIDRCPPGGVATLKALAAVLKVDPTPYVEGVHNATRAPAIAHILETECIGCTKCISACPVDAIVGSAKQMHAILTHECTGCGLCVEPCPVDCIEMTPIARLDFDKTLAKSRHQAKRARMLQHEQEKQLRYREKRTLAQKDDLVMDKKAKQDYILQALARVHLKKGHE